jgi:Flp pilus assembly protein TadD
VRNRIILSDLLQRQGRHQEAMTEAYLAAVGEPPNAEAFGHLGALLRQNGDKAAAEQAFRRAVALAPNNAHFRHELSVIFVQQGRNAEAVEAATEAAAREPRNPHRLQHLAALQGAVQDYAGVEKSLNSAIEIAPDNLALRSALSQFLIKHGRVKDAISSFRLFVESRPNDTQALGYLAALLEQAGDLEEAESVARRAVGIDPSNAELRKQLDDLAARIGGVAVAVH